MNQQRRAKAQAAEREMDMHFGGREVDVGGGGTPGGPNEEDFSRRRGGGVAEKDPVEPKGESIEERLIGGLRQQILLLQVENETLQRRSQEPQMQAAQYTYGLAEKLQKAEKRSSFLEVEVSKKERANEEERTRSAAQLGQLERENKALMQSLKTSQAKEKEAERRLHETQERLKGVERQLALAMTDVEVMEKEKTRLERELDVQTRQMRHHDEEVTGAYERMMQMERELQGDIAEKQATLEVQGAEVARLTEQLQAKEEDARRLETLHMASLVQAGESPAARALEETREFGKRDSKAAALHKAEAEGQRAEMDKCRAMVQELRTARDQLRQEVATLREANLELEKKAEAFDEVDLERQRLSSESQSCREDTEKALEEKAELEGKVTDLLARLRTHFDSIPEAGRDGWLVAERRRAEEAERSGDQLAQERDNALELRKSCLEDLALERTRARGLTEDRDRLSRLYVVEKKVSTEEAEKNLELSKRAALANSLEAEKEQLEQEKAELIEENAERVRSLEVELSEAKEQLNTWRAHAESIKNSLQGLGGLAKLQVVGESLGGLENALRGMGDMDSEEKEPEKVL